MGNISLASPFPLCIPIIMLFLKELYGDSENDFFRCVVQGTINTNCNIVLKNIVAIMI